jgi:hypothetical protein
MSITALNWAGRTVTGSASRKAVLFCLANYANESDEAYPSVETIARITELNAKTVRIALNELESNGLISDTGRRRGQTQNIRVWALNTTGETLPKTEPYQKRNPTDFGRETLPKMDLKPYQKRVGEPKGEPLVDPKLDNLGSRYSREPKTAPLIPSRSIGNHSMDWLLDRPAPAKRESEPEARARRAIELSRQLYDAEDDAELERINQWYRDREAKQIDAGEPK